MSTAPSTATGTRSVRSRALDGWRAVACLLVLFYHTGFTLHCGPFIVWGFTGVHFFFVLSGYLLFRPFYKVMRSDSPFCFGRFYVRRALRIYPAYLLALAAFGLLRYAFRLHPPSARDLVTHLLFIFNSADQYEFFGINVAFWTLAIEAQFYVLLPLLTWFVYRLTGRRAAWSMFATAALFLGLGVSTRALELLRTTGPGFTLEPAIRFHTVFSFLDFFAAGMIVAAFDTTVHPSKLFGRPAVTVLLVLGTSMFLLANAWCSATGAGDWMLINNFYFLWGFPVLLCAGLAALFAVVVRSESLLTRLLANRVMVYVGTISYGVYLFHILVQLPMFKLLPLASVEGYGLRTFLWGCISLGPTLLLATALYRFVEQPFLNVAARFRS